MTERVRGPKLSELKWGSKLKADAGFSCLEKGEIVELRGPPYARYVCCAEGRHYLDGQVDFDDCDTLIGLVKVEG